MIRTYLWLYCIRYLVCCHHFEYVFVCIFGMSHHFMGKNGVVFGIVHHFWFFRVYSRDGHDRTIFVFGRKTNVCVSKTNIASWTITMCKVLLLDSYKYTIILYYYSIFSYHKGGVVYILEQAAGCQERHISSIHTLIAIFEFGNDFDKTLKNQHSYHF